MSFSPGCFKDIIASNQNFFCFVLGGELITNYVHSVSVFVIIALSTRFINTQGCFAGFVMEVNLRVSSFGCLCPFLVLIIFFEYLITPLNLWCEMVFYALTIKDKSLLLKRNEGEWGFFHELFFNCFNIPRG